MMKTIPAQPAPRSLVEAHQQVAQYQQHIRHNLQSLPVAHRTQSTGATEQQPAAPAKVAGRAGTPLAPCPTICRSAFAICRSAAAICRISRQFPDDPPIQQACSQARQQCYQAHQTCLDCQGK